MKWKIYHYPKRKLGYANESMRTFQHFIMSRRHEKYRGTVRGSIERYYIYFQNAYAKYTIISKTSRKISVVTPWERKEITYTNRQIILIGITYPSLSLSANGENV